MKPNDSAYYAALIRTLRSGLAYNEKNNRAADALEAVLADRDALMAVNAEFSVVFKERDDAIAERDALAARLAPVDDKALVETVAHFEANFDGWPFSVLERLDQDLYRLRARGFLSAIRPHIEAAERERCAKIADDCDKSTHPADVAAAIRRGE